MWRRACLGDRDAVIAVGYLWIGIAVAIVVVIAARAGWPTALGCGAGAGLVMLGAYWWRRRRWDRLIRRQGLEGVAAVEFLLRQRSQGTG